MEDDEDEEGKGEVEDDLAKEDKAVDKEDDKEEDDEDKEEEKKNE